jgi:hypothetical protein
MIDEDGCTGRESCHSRVAGVKLQPDSATSDFCCNFTSCGTPLNVEVFELFCYEHSALNGENIWKICVLH